MKRNLLLISIFLALSVLLSACGGTAVASSWPGVSVVGDTAYLAFNASVYAINTQNGQELWRFPSEAIKGAAFYAAPAIAEDGSLVVGGYNKILYGLSAAGQQTWSFAEAKNPYVGSVLVTADRIYAPNGNGTLYALDRNGQKVWEFKSKHSLWAQPVLKGDCLLVAALDHHLYCLDPQSGEELWKSEDLGGGIVDAPSVGEEDVIYVGTLANTLVSIKATTGEVINVFKAGGWVWSSPLVYEGNLYFGDLNGNFYSIDAATFEQNWAIQPESTVKKRQILGRPLVVDGVLYFGSETGSLFSVDPASGKTLSTRTVDGKLYAGLVAAGDLILAAPSEGASPLVAMDANGTIQWSFTPVAKK